MADAMMITDIEKELKRLWDENKHEKKIKACLFTLIIYSTECPRGEIIREVTQSLIQEYPCRIISIDERLSEKCLNVQVFQHTTLEGESLIACDRIQITASQEYLQRIPFIVIPEIVPDLPVYMIWGSDVVKENPVLEELEKYATKIVFDAGSSASLTDFSKILYHKIGTVPYMLQDFHWVLTIGWRKCLFQTFSSEEGINFLKAVTSMKITFNDVLNQKEPLVEIIAWYLQAWLAGQLNWSLQAVQNRTITYASQTGPIRVDLIPEISKKYTHGAILSIEIKNQSGETYLFIPLPEKDKVTVYITHQKHCEMPLIYPFTDLQRRYNFVRELFFFGESPHYVKTLKQLAEVP